MSNWSNKNAHLRDSWESSILGIKDGNTQWRYDFTKYLVSTTKYNNQRFFWELIPMIRFIKDKESIAFTDADCNIFLSAPHDMVPMDNEKWEFIYYHECLHQMFETFATAEKIKENEGACNHQLLNVASDCIINEQLHNGYNMDYPTADLVTPEYIKDKYQIEYDRKNDDQYDLYMKMLDAWDKMKDDPIIQQAFDDMPEVDVDMNGDSDSKSPKTSKIPSSDEFKAGSKAARHAANEILQKYSNAVKKQANGKISVDDTIDSLTKAIAEIRSVLVGKPDNKKSVKEFFNTKILSSHKFILEAEKTSIDPNFSSYEQGWEYALNDVLAQAENLIQQISNPGGGGSQDPGGEINEVPENDPSEEAPFLPKVNSPGSSNDDSDKDSQDNQNSDKNSDSQDNDSKENSSKSQEGGDKNDSNDSNSDSNSDIDDMSGNAAEKDAEKSADEAQKAADEAKEAAEQVRKKADKSGNAVDKQNADKAEAAADKAQKAADEAKQEADDAKEANESGNEEETKKHAKSARSKASEAKSSAKDAKDLNSESDSNANDGDKNKNNKKADIDWDAKDRDAEISSELIDKIKSFNEKNIGEMSSDEAKNIIRKFTSSIDKSSTLGDFVKKCHSSSTKSKDGIIVQTVMQKRNVSWGEKFSNVIKNTVKQRVGKKLNDWEKTFRRPNRRQGVIHDGDIIQKGKMRKKDRLTISLAFYIDCSGSMDDSNIEKIFKFAYKLEDYLQKKYRRNPVVDGCIFDYYKFTNGIKRVTPPAIPRSGGGTDDLDILLNNIITVAKDHMINVIITDGVMDITPNEVKSQLDQLAGNVVYITNNTGIESVLNKVKQLCGNGAQNVGNKFEHIVTSNFNLSSSDFAQI